jgi:hypothetical protein
LRRDAGLEITAEYDVARLFDGTPGLAAGYDFIRARLDHGTGIARWPGKWAPSFHFGAALPWGKGVSEVFEPDNKGGVVLMMAGGPLGWIVANGLAARLGPLTVIEETPEDRWTILARRARRVGWLRAAGQVAFGQLEKALWRLRKARVDQIIASHGLQPVPSGCLAVHRVASVNAAETHALLARLAPAVVAVYGTRVLSQATLDAVAAPFVNYHAGITPAYRGQTPAYWALVRGEPENVGVTIHLVDKGVDTGDVLHQARVPIGPEDTITSHPYLQAGYALPLLARAIDDARAGRLAPRPVATRATPHWFPPTLWRYVFNGLVRGVW